MRTATIRLSGRDYPLCFSTRVVRACTERYGGVDKISAALDASGPVSVLDESLWLLAAMLDAGARYARLNGQECPPPPTQEALYDLCGMDDLGRLRANIMETMTRGQSRTVEVEPPKNAVATQDGAGTEGPSALSGTSGMA